MKKLILTNYNTEEIETITTWNEDESICKVKVFLKFDRKLKKKKKNG